MLIIKNNSTEKLHWAFIEADMVSKRQEPRMDLRQRKFDEESFKRFEFFIAPMTPICWHWPNVILGVR